MFRTIVVVLCLLLAVPLASAGPSAPEPRSPPDDCETTYLPAGFYVEECEREYVVGGSWGG